MMSRIFNLAGGGDLSESSEYVSNGDPLNSQLYLSGWQQKNRAISDNVLINTSRSIGMNSGISAVMDSLSQSKVSSLGGSRSAWMLGVAGMLGSMGGEDFEKGPLEIAGIATAQIGLTAAAAANMMYTKGNYDNKTVTKKREWYRGNNRPNEMLDGIFGNETVRNLAEDYKFENSMLRQGVSPADASKASFSHLAKAAKSMKMMNYASIGFGFFDMIGDLSRTQSAMNASGAGGLVSNVHQRFQNVHTKTYQDSELTQRSRMELTSSVSEISQNLMNLTYQRNQNGIQYMSNNI